MLVSKAVIAGMLLYYGIPSDDVSTLTCIAEKESNLNAKAINHKNRNKTKDHGLFQINDINKKLCNVTSKDLLEVRQNIQCAVKVYKVQNLKAWTTYRFCKKEKYEARNDPSQYKHWISFHSPHTQR